MISFHRRKNKVRIATKEQVPMPKDATPLYAEGVLLDGLADDEVNSFLKDHPKIFPLFYIDIMEVVSLYVSEPTEGDQDVDREPNPKSMEELRHAREALKRELVISQRVKASTLKDISLGTNEDPRLLKIAKELTHDERSALISLLSYYKVVFAWLYSDMKGLDPRY